MGGAEEGPAADGAIGRMNRCEDRGDGFGRDARGERGENDQRK